MNYQEVQCLNMGDKLLPRVKTISNGINFKAIEYMTFCQRRNTELGFIMLSVECFKPIDEKYDGSSWGVYTVRAKDVKPEKIDKDTYDIFECK